MTPKTLKEFKERVRGLNKVLTKIILVWDNPQYVVIEVLLQNLGFDSADCVGYSHEKDLKRCEVIINALREMKEFDSHHLINWIFEEVNNSYVGYSYIE